MIVIIGGGISGLAAAFELTQRRIPFRLLEASSRLGGVILTERSGGFTIDAGADSLLAAKPAGQSLCGELGLAPLLQTMSEPRTAYVLARGRLFPLPTPSVLGLPVTARAAMQFNLLPLRARLRLLLEPFVPAQPQSDESIASFFRRRFGAATVPLIAQPLLGGIHAGSVEDLSVRSLFPSLIEAEATGAVLRSLRPSSGGAFNSLAGGMETLPLAIAKALPAAAVRCDVRVCTVTAARSGWRIEGENTGAEPADAVVLAVPVHVTARLLRTIDAQAAAYCADVPHASTVTVALAWRRDAITHRLRGSGFVVSSADNGYRITACTWVSSKWEGRAPREYALLRAFIGGVHDGAAIDLPDEQLSSIAVRDLSRVLGISEPPVLTRVYRWRDGSPQLNVGHLARVREIERRLETHPSLFITGRGFRTVGIPDCISDARRAAAAAARVVTGSHGHAKVDEHIHR